ncbi:hypothetical protein J6590_031004 [Homalodisca vitripennis]|nr:hypothetical protein J6590_031004 [Homalodisca vitripennis]
MADVFVAESGKVLEEALHNDQLVISVKHIKPRRRVRTGVETLLAIDFPGSRQKMVMQLDRRSRRAVTVVSGDSLPISLYCTCSVLPVPV